MCAQSRRAVLGGHWPPSAALTYQLQARKHLVGNDQEADAWSASEMCFQSGLGAKRVSVDALREAYARK